MIKSVSKARFSLAKRVQQRFASSYVSPAALHHIESRWTQLPEAEQGAIADELAEAQRGDWKKMTVEQKRAAYYIAYGPYGARAATDPILVTKVAISVAGFLAATTVLWLAWESYGKPSVHTMAPEWKAASDRIAVENKMNPFSGAYAAELKKAAKQD